MRDYIIKSFRLGYDERVISLEATLFIILPELDQSNCLLRQVPWHLILVKYVGFFGSNV